MKFNQKGSVLILVLWSFTLLSLFALSVAFRTRLLAKMEGYEAKRFERSYDFLTAVNLARLFIESDKNPEVDSPSDSWYGVPADFSGTDFVKKMSLSLQDEESKINVNTASPGVLRRFFEILRNHGVRLKASPEDLALSIAAWRGDGAQFGKTTLGFPNKAADFESLEELYLIQYADAEDVGRIRPFLTVYGADLSRQLLVNLNTVHPYILEALIEDLPGSVSEKKTLFAQIERFRNFNGDLASPRQIFRQEHLHPKTLAEVLSLQPSVEMISLLTYFCRYVTVDSHSFQIKVVSKLGDSEIYQMEAVIGKRNLDILSWREGRAV